MLRWTPGTSCEGRSVAIATILAAVAFLAIPSPARAIGGVQGVQASDPVPIDLGWQRHPTPHLPASIQIYRSTRPLPSGEPISGVYARIDLTDPGLTIEATYAGDEGTWITPLQEMTGSEARVYVAVNGTYFSQTTSVSPVVQGGRVLAFGRRGLTRAGQDFVATWGAWGLGPDGRAEVVWTWSLPESNRILAFDAPYPNRLGQPPLPTPSVSGPGMPPGRVWAPDVAIGGTPVLIKDGVLRHLGEDPEDPESLINRDELVNPGGLTGRHPRTVIGHTQDRSHVILMVIDGRQPDHSVGATLAEMGAIMIDVGAFEALNIDGGGSSVMIADNGDGTLDLADVLSRPSDAAGMRPVATSLLVRAASGTGG